MRGLTCDRCGNQTNDYGNSEEGWTHIDLGTKLIGHRDYQDLCPPCTMWLIDILDKERKEIGV
jgi:hypothetical protein